MTTAFKPGDQVRWETPQGETHGEVVRVIRSRDHIGGHTVAASRDDPQYEVRSAATGKHAVHRATALRAARSD